jgi:hypothetical protein
VGKKKREGGREKERVGEREGEIESMGKSKSHLEF